MTSNLTGATIHYHHFINLEISYTIFSIKADCSTLQKMYLSGNEMIEFVNLNERVLLSVDFVEVRDRQVRREVAQPAFKEVFNMRIIFLQLVAEVRRTQYCR